MTELRTAAQIRRIEAVAIALGQVTGLELMERAGRGVVDAVFEEWPELKATSHRAVVLCGPGNNGGDGFVVARLLKEWGWEVEVFLYGDPDRMPPDARVNYERWRGMGEVSPLRKRSGSDVVLFIDALFATGLTRELPKHAIEFAEHLFDTRGSTFFVSVDMLSGICADSGRVIGAEALLPYVDLTISFHCPKLGHRLDNGVRDSGELDIASIGLEAGLRDHPNRVVILANPPRRRFRKFLAKYKYSYGHALILSGPPGRCGAARLVARGALRIGAGVVTLGCPPEALAENAARLDAIMVRPWGSAEGLAAAFGDERINAVCVGPGLGLDAYGEQMLRAVMQAQTGA